MARATATGILIVSAGKLADGTVATARPIQKGASSRRRRPTMSDTVVVTRSGPVRGRTAAGVRTFLGIPYAAPPVGPQRFRKPAPHTPWSEVRDATVPGATAPQNTPPPLKALDTEALMGVGWLRGDDYLTVNVWAPEGETAALPVMVFIHGGSFTAGSNTVPVYDGSSFARDGVVCMAINYRMGVDGFLPIPGVPTNLGLRDMIAALEWIRDNAPAFGGDPANVTVFGESAGAMAIADLIASPLCKGLFRRAIVQSGHASMTRSIAVTERVTRKLAKMLRIPATIDGFNSVTPEQTLVAEKKVQLPTSGLDLRDEAGREPVYGLSRFAPVHGDDVLPLPPLQAIAEGAGAEVDLMIGTNLEEMNIYVVPIGAQKWVGSMLATYVLGKFIPRSKDILKAYGLGRKGRKPGQVLTEALSDLVFRLPARACAAAHQGRTHLYEFNWTSPAFDGQLGACHALEIPFVFDTLACVTGPKGFVGPNPPQAVADYVHKVWIDFARDGGAPWPEYDPRTRQVHALDTGVTATDAPMPAAPFWP